MDGKTKKKTEREFAFSQAREEELREKYQRRLMLKYLVAFLFGILVNESIHRWLAF